MLVSSMTIIAHDYLCSTRAYHLRIDLAHDATVGKRCMENKKFLRTRKIMVVHSKREGRVLSTYPRRPKAEALTQRG